MTQLGKPFFSTLLLCCIDVFARKTYGSEFVSLSVVRITWNTHSKSPNRFEFEQLDFAILQRKKKRINTARDWAFVSWRFSGVAHSFHLIAFVNVVFVVGRWFALTQMWRRHLDASLISEEQKQNQHAVLIAKFQFYSDAVTSHLSETRI